MDRKDFFKSALAAGLVRAKDPRCDGCGAPRGRFSECIYCGAPGERQFPKTGAYSINTFPISSNTTAW